MYLCNHLLLLLLLLELSTILVDCFMFCNVIQIVVTSA